METEFAMRGLLSGADIGIIGGADGPTAVLVARSAFLWLLPLIALGLLTAVYLAMRRAARKKRHSVTELPAGYRRIYTVDMRQSRRLLLFLGLAQLLVALAMLIPACLLVPLSPLFSMERGVFPFLMRFLTLIVGSIGYILLHELIHAAVMRIYGAHKIRFGVSGGCAYAGSEQDYFDRFSYMQIALSPLIGLGLCLAVLNLMVPIEWFWVIYLIQLTNVSGAVGDLFVSVRFSRFPRDILVKDTGVSMTVYSKQ